ncbi:hypothetical protein E3N88_00400 [Mikania micrantha]|uniref:STICHEL DnaA-N-like alpha-beta domain-containing protein n=1 Tax=Mikania micrantha TaxID=192012 RepID=A0A5N6PY10_9ASTR|nr:hypothetical protein E3N88_00400 [Mikania micrantha]
MGERRDEGLCVGMLSSAGLIRLPRLEMEMAKLDVTGKPATEDVHIITTMFVFHEQNHKGSLSLAPPIVSADESLKRLVLSQCNQNNGCESEMLKDKEALELIWSRAMELCNSISLSYLLKRHGRLAFVCFHQGLAVVELKFHHPDYASKADKSWKLIASALHVAMGCNVEIMICHSDNPKIKKSSFRLFSCARGNKLRSNKNAIELSENINAVSDGGSHDSNTCQKKEVAARILRNTDGNAFRTVTTH